CISCAGGYPYCKQCILCTHLSQPLHIIDKWDSSCSYFIKVSLQLLSLKYQLGYIPGQYCTVPRPGHANFMVINSDVLHSVAIAYCGCQGSPDQCAQLLEIGWWPSCT
ncbi:hypothetical protein BT96DRAFT_833289, partial [Gymnopus androsaceus JB14]